MKRYSTPLLKRKTELTPSWLLWTSRFPLRPGWKSPDLRLTAKYLKSIKITREHAKLTLKLRNSLNTPQKRKQMRISMALQMDHNLVPTTIKGKRKRSMIWLNSSVRWQLNLVANWKRRRLEVSKKHHWIPKSLKTTACLHCNHLNTQVPRSEDLKILLYLNK